MSDDRVFDCRVSMNGSTEFPDATVNVTALTEDGEEIVTAVREAIEEVVE